MLVLDESGATVADPDLKSGRLEERQRPVVHRYVVDVEAVSYTHLFVADAVAKANEEWDANAALGKEVENRNESLAAKFEMLKNRAVAIAEQFGGPLADSLLDVIDAAEPLIKMISDGAKQFSEMSKSEQQAVLKAVALSAAIGPLLTVVGKGTPVSYTHLP